MAEESFINIKKEGPRNLRQIRFSEEDLDEIRDNPRGLTIEGCLVRIGQWVKSNNQHVLFKYLAMVRNCKSFTKSGETTDERIILSRKPGKKGEINITKIWSEVKDKVMVDSLKQLAETRSKDLVFLTRKGGWLKLPEQLSGYETTANSKDLKEITVTAVGIKTFLDAIPLINPLDYRAENDSEGNPIYEGYAAPGTTDATAGWAIRKITFDNNGAITEQRWADGTFTFDKKWTLNSSYDYTP